MGRLVKGWKDESVHPCRVQPYKEADGINSNHKEARANAPYREGDVLLANLFTASDPDVRRVRVLQVLSRYSDYCGEHVEYYRVQTETREGRWSKDWRYVHRGHVYSAYFDEGNRPRFDQITDNTCKRCGLQRGEHLHNRQCEDGQAGEFTLLTEQDIMSRLAAALGAMLPEYRRFVEDCGHDPASGIDCSPDFARMADAKEALGYYRRLTSPRGA